MERWKKRMVDMVAGLALAEEKDPSVIPYIPQKTEVSDRDTPYFRRSAPERHGMSSHVLCEMLHAMEDDTRVNLHSILVLHDGEVVCECSRPGYESGLCHLSHSMSKTVTAIAVGLLVDRNKLDLREPLVDFFPNVPYRDKKFPKILPEHLLNMSAGVAFGEAGTITEENWTEAYFGSAVNFEPGTSFAYNSMNSYVLGRLVERVAARPLLDLLNEYVFSVLDIRNAFWEIGPEGYEKGGFGLHLSPESWAKLGMLILNGGVWEGKRVLSEEWVRSMTDTHNIAPSGSGDYNYGYHIWVHRTADAYLFNGMLGQNVWIYPERRIVAVITAGNNELFQQSPALDLLSSHLMRQDAYLPATRVDFRRLREAKKHFFEKRAAASPLPPVRSIAAWLGLRSKTPFPKGWSRMLTTYRFCENNAALLPFFVRVMQNNYTDGIREVTFTREGERLFFTSHEGRGSFRIEIGLYGYAQTILDINGERYIVRAMGQMLNEGEGEPSFLLEILFPELPNTRIIRFSFPEEGGVCMHLNETPDHHIAERYFADFAQKNSAKAFLFEMFEKRFGDRFFYQKMVRLFDPVLIGASIEDENADAILQSQQRQTEERIRRVRWIVALLSRFLDAGREKDAPTFDDSPVDTTLLVQQLPSEDEDDLVSDFSQDEPL